MLDNIQVTNRIRMADIRITQFNWLKGSDYSIKSSLSHLQNTHKPLNMRKLILLPVISCFVVENVILNFSLVHTHIHLQKER